MQIIAGKHRFQKLYVPKSQHIRPTSSYLRECLFNICQGLVEESLFLDLFAGCGAMGLEALSRGASHAIFVDDHHLSIKSIKQNIQKLSEHAKSEVVFGDVFEVLKSLTAKHTQFDIIYADPPYHVDPAKIPISIKVLEFIDNHPSLMKDYGHLFLEDAKNTFEEHIVLKNLILKSARKMGVSTLKEYTLKK